MRNALLSLLLIGALATQAAGYCSPTVTTNCAETAWPTLPSTGGKFTDPDYGTEVMRVTDSTSNAGHNFTAPYAYWPTFNCVFNASPCAGTGRIMTFDLGDSSANFYTLNKTTFTLANKVNVTDTTSSWNGGEYWSKTDPDVVYVMETVGRRLFAYNVSTNTRTTVRDFTPEIGSSHYLFQMFMSADLTAFAAIVYNTADYSVYGGFAYNLTTATTLIYQAALTNNEMHMSRGGRYVIAVNDTPLCGAGSPQCVRVYDTANSNAMTELNYNATDRGFSHMDELTSYAVGHDYDNEISRRALSNVTGTRVSLQTYLSDYTQGDHTSNLIDNETWVLTSTFEALVAPTNSCGGPCTHTTGRFHNELFLVKVDGSQSVYRFLHHHSVFPTGGYWESPRANISGNGQWAAFTSNNDSAAGRLDMYVAYIPNSPVPSALCAWHTSPACQ